MLVNQSVKTGLQELIRDNNLRYEAEKSAASTKFKMAMDALNAEKPRPEDYNNRLDNINIMNAEEIREINTRHRENENAIRTTDGASGQTFKNNLQMLIRENNFRYEDEKHAASIRWRKAMNALNAEKPRPGNYNSRLGAINMAHNTEMGEIEKRRQENEKTLHEQSKTPKSAELKEQMQEMQLALTKVSGQSVSSTTTPISAESELKTPLVFNGVPKESIMKTPVNLLTPVSEPATVHTKGPDGGARTKIQVQILKSADVLGVGHTRIGVYTADGNVEYYGFGSDSPMELSASQQQASYLSSRGVDNIPYEPTHKVIKEQPVAESGRQVLTKEITLDAQQMHKLTQFVAHSQEHAKSYFPIGSNCKSFVNQALANADLNTSVNELFSEAEMQELMGVKGLVFRGF